MQVQHRFIEIIEDWSHLVRREGFAASMRRILTDAARLPYRRLHFVILARSLLDPIPDVPPVVGLSIRVFEEADLPAVWQMDSISSANLCAQRLAHGHTGFIALWEGQPAGYTWGSPDPQMRLEKVHIPLQPGDFLCTDSFTFPGYRGKGIQTALTLARFRWFQLMGYCRAICYIDVHNGPSLAVWQRKFNSQMIGTIDFMRIGPWYRIRYA
jgi:GNAT superfamily N-acetyltransferase